MIGKGLSVDDAVAELEAAAGDATLAAGLDDGGETKMEFKSTSQLSLYDEQMLQRQLPSLYAPSRYVLLQPGSGLQIGKGTLNLIVPLTFPANPAHSLTRSP